MVENKVIKMEANTIKIKFPRKTRAHYVLFAEDSPFKQKVVAPKNNYKRKEKHRTKIWNSYE